MAMPRSDRCPTSIGSSRDVLSLPPLADSREHERALLAGETTERFPKPKVSHEALRRIDDIEGEMRKKLAAMANFNEPERAMLLKVICLKCSVPTCAHRIHTQYRRAPTKRSPRC
jgi:hypothetical protein